MNTPGASIRFIVGFGLFGLLWVAVLVWSSQWPTRWQRQIIRATLLAAIVLTLAAIALLADALWIGLGHAHTTPKTLPHPPRLLLSKRKCDPDVTNLYDAARFARACPDNGDPPALAALSSPLHLAIGGQDLLPPYYCRGRLDKACYLAPPAAYLRELWPALQVPCQPYSRGIDEPRYGDKPKGVGVQLHPDCTVAPREEQDK
jgi:hypothetical protein